MSIPFTQFLRPDGRRKDVTINRPAEVEAAAQKVIAAGFAFEIEELRSGEISMEVCDADGERVLAAEVCFNGPPVIAAVDKLVMDAYAELPQS